MKNPLYAVMLHGIITNVSYDVFGKTQWLKAIYDTVEEARERAAYMNELEHHNYYVEQITCKRGARV